MCFLMGWALKLSAVGVIYLGMTSGFKVKLPDQPAAQVITLRREGRARQGGLRIAGRAQVVLGSSFCDRRFRGR
jgi:hypothetical protein